MLNGKYWIELREQLRCQTEIRKIWETSTSFDKWSWFLRRRLPSSCSRRKGETVLSTSSCWWVFVVYKTAWEILLLLPINNDDDEDELRNYNGFAFHSWLISKYFIRTILDVGGAGRNLYCSRWNLFHAEDGKSIDDINSYIRFWKVFWIIVVKLGSVFQINLCHILMALFPFQIIDSQALPSGRMNTFTFNVRCNWKEKTEITVNRLDKKAPDWNHHPHHKVMDQVLLAYYWHNYYYYYPKPMLRFWLKVRPLLNKWELNANPSSPNPGDTLDARHV